MERHRSITLERNRSFTLDSRRTHCGQCERCHTTLEEGANFCSRCGETRTAREARRTADSSGDESDEMHLEGEVTYVRSMNSLASLEGGVMGVTLTRDMCKEKERDESRLDEVADLWTENQDLHDRILRLEDGMRELEADKADLEHELQARAVEKPGRRSTTSQAKVAGLDDRAAVDHLLSLKHRLRWQKVITAVISQNKAVRLAVCMIKLQWLQDRRTSNLDAPVQLWKQLEEEKLASKVQQATLEAERQSMSERFAMERLNLERENQSLLDRMAALEKATRSMARRPSRVQEEEAEEEAEDEEQDTIGDSPELLLVQSGGASPSSKGVGKHGELPTGVQFVSSAVSSAATSLADDIREAPMGSARASECTNASSGSSSVSRPTHSGGSGESRDSTWALPSSMPRVAKLSSSEVDQLAEEVENWKHYAQSLEKEVVDSAMDGEELHLLRQQVRYLEQALKDREADLADATQPVSWWSAVAQACCAAGREEGIKAAPGKPAWPAPFVLEQKVREQKDKEQTQATARSSVAPAASAVDVGVPGDAPAIRSSVKGKQGS